MAPTIIVNPWQSDGLWDFDLARLPDDQLHGAGLDRLRLPLLGLVVGALGVMLVIHFYEAILAGLAILIWHLSSTIFNPPVYPDNPSW